MSGLMCRTLPLPFKRPPGQARPHVTMATVRLRPFCAGARGPAHCLPQARLRGAAPSEQGGGVLARAATVQSSAHPGGAGREPGRAWWGRCPAVRCARRRGRTTGLELEHHRCSQGDQLRTTWRRRARSGAFWETSLVMAERRACSCMRGGRRAPR